MANNYSGPSLAAGPYVGGSGAAIVSDAPMTQRMLKQLIEAGDRLAQARSRIEAEIERLVGPYPVNACGSEGPAAPGDLYHIEAHITGLFSTAERLSAAADRLTRI